MVTIYGIKNCDTMKKAFAWCDERGIAYTFHDYKKQGVPRDQLVAFVDCVRRQDAKTICDVNVGWADCATILMANQSVETGGWISFPV